MIVGSLCALLIFQQLFWMIHSHRLINKLMSRNYHDYQVAMTVAPPKPAKVQEPEPMEDFGALHGIGLDL